jgi:hypothetical protein
VWPFSGCRRSHRILRVKSRPPLASQQWTERILVQAHLGWRSRVIVDRQHVKTARALAQLTLAESLCRAHPTRCLSVVTLNAGKASVFTVRVRTSTNAASCRRTRSDRFRPSPRTACNFAPQAHSRAAANTDTHRSRPECLLRCRNFPATCVCSSTGSPIGAPSASPRKPSRDAHRTVSNTSPDKTGMRRSESFYNSRAIYL